MFSIKKTNLLFIVCAVFFFYSYPANSQIWQIVNPDVIQGLNNTVKKHPNPNNYFNLGIAYAKTSYMEKSWAALKKTHDLDSNYFQKVITINQKKIVNNTSDVEALFKLSIAYYFTGNKQISIMYHEKILKIQPKFIWSYNYLGFIFKEKGQLTRSINILQQGLKIDPENAMTHFLLGQTYYMKNMPDMAYQEIELGMKLKTKNPF